MERRILVVDDEEDILIVIRMLLEEDGMKVFTAANSKDALEMFAIVKPQVVLSDLNLGPGMDGLTLCGKIRTEVPKTVTIAMSGYMTAYDISYCLGSGMFNDAIAKPWNNKLLIQILNEWFKKRERWDTVNGIMS